MTTLPMWLIRGAFIQVKDITRFIEECSENPDDDNFYNVAISKDIIVPVIPPVLNSLDAILTQMDEHNTMGLDVILHTDHQSPLTIHVPGIRAYFIRV
jgi:hypothetical protein